MNIRSDRRILKSVNIINVRNLIVFVPCVFLHSVFSPTNAHNTIQFIRVLEAVPCFGTSVPKHGGVFFSTYI